MRSEKLIEINIVTGLVVIKSDRKSTFFKPKNKNINSYLCKINPDTDKVKIRYVI